MRGRVLLGEALLRLWGATWRVDWDGQDQLDQARRASPRGSVIFTFWHSSLLMLGYTHRGRGIRVLVSQHRDGEWIARILRRLGLGLVRGSSRRGGVEALFQLATQLESGHDVAITVDGPIGPRYTVHPGAVLLARRTGHPIVPLIPSFDRGWRLGTWDELRVPRPWTRVHVRRLAPFFVDADLPQSELVATQAQLESVLRQATRAAEAQAGRSIDFDDVVDRRSFWERASEVEPPHRALVGLAAVHALGLGIERRLRPRRRGVAARPWVLGVGNLEAGGTGKTPCVVDLAQAIAARGARVAVLTRGHRGALGRTPEFATAASLERAADETRLLVAALGDSVPVLVSRDKAAGLARLRATRRFDVVVVDDAFQTAGLAVDRHLVLLDWSRPLGNGALLPAGRLREGPGALRRATALLFTRATADTLPEHPAWAARRASCFLARETVAGWRRPDGTRFDPEVLRDHGVALLSGLGRPQAFERLARAGAAVYGFQVRRAVRVGDHAAIEAAVAKLTGQLASLGCTAIVVTAKDAARLAADSKWNEPLLVLEQRLEIQDRDRLLEALLPPDHYLSAKFAKVTDSDTGM